MRKLRINLPMYDGRDTDAHTIARIAERYNLTYEAAMLPILEVADADTNEVLLESAGNMLCYVSGEEIDIERFLNELKLWME